VSSARAAWQEVTQQPAGKEAQEGRNERQRHNERRRTRQQEAVVAWQEVTQQPARQEVQEGHNERRRHRRTEGGSMMRSDATTSQTRGVRGARWEAVVQWEAEAQVDGKQQCDERRRNNQPDKRRKRGMVRGGSAMKGGGAGGREAVAWREATQQLWHAQSVERLPRTMLSKLGEGGVIIINGGCATILYFQALLWQRILCPQF
jgi:hypothetical protein